MKHHDEVFASFLSTERKGEEEKTAVPCDDRRHCIVAIIRLVPHAPTYTSLPLQVMLVTIADAGSHLPLFQAELQATYVKGVYHMCIVCNWCGGSVNFEPHRGLEVMRKRKVYASAFTRIQVELCA